MRIVSDYQRSTSPDLLLGSAALIGLVAATRSLIRRRRRFELRDKVALVTGGGRGLGLVLARELGRVGARVAICGRDEDELARASDELAGAGVEVLALTCDLTDRDRVDEMLTQVREGLGPVDVLINNAGAIQV